MDDTNASLSTSESPDVRGTEHSTAGDLHDLLTRVAAGQIDPAEAARLLDEDASAPTLDQVERPLVATSPAVTSITILAGGVKLVVVADPTVATAVAEGPHAARHDGSTLVIEAPRGDGYQVQGRPKYLGWVPAVWTGGRGEKVTVRVNPDLPLTVEASACSIEVTGLHSALTVKADAASVKVREHRGTLHGTARMCSVSIRGAITGESSFLCEFGGLDLRLDAESDVVVHAVAEMGSLKLGGDHVSQDASGMGMRGSTGNGAHSFDLTVRMGSVSVVAA